MSRSRLWHYWTNVDFQSAYIFRMRRSDGLVHAHASWYQGRWLSLCASFRNPKQLVTMTRPTKGPVTCIDCIAVMP